MRASCQRSAAPLAPHSLACVVLHHAPAPPSSTCAARLTPFLSRRSRKKPRQHLRRTWVMSGSKRRGQPFLRHGGFASCAPFVMITSTLPHVPPSCAMAADDEAIGSSREWPEAERRHSWIRGLPRLYLHLIN
uniref:Uncharacterized protein n=1 Tax=Oryza sativa subsp. japonica TaxID=39947 RepID=Q651P1_ORYSJ|nr:hypothetical protein [Oryza sativa Japonica Group]